MTRGEEIRFIVETCPLRIYVQFDKRACVIRESSCWQCLSTPARDSMNSDGAAESRLSIDPNSADSDLSVFIHSTISDYRQQILTEHRVIIRKQNKTKTSSL